MEKSILLLLSIIPVLLLVISTFYNENKLLKAKLENMEKDISEIKHHIKNSDQSIFSLLQKVWQMDQLEINATFAQLKQSNMEFNTTINNITARLENTNNYISGLRHALEIATHIIVSSSKKFVSYYCNCINSSNAGIVL